MKTKKSNLNTIFTVIFGILAIGIILIEIATVNDKTTKLETSLFNLLQVIFSIGFSWLLTRTSMKDEFIASQKKFAVSAFRRINEIDLGVHRLRKRLRLRISASSHDTHHELEVIEAIASGVHDSIQSSKADWSEIIGEEIDTLEKIQELQGDRTLLMGELPIIQDISAQDTSIRHEQKIEGLINSLPYSLQAVARAKRRETLDDLIKKLESEHDKKGFVELEGFWDTTFEKDVRTFLPGNSLTCRIGNAGKRIGAMIAYDDASRSVGVIINNLGCRYSHFKEAILQYVGKSEFSIELIEIENNGYSVTDRHYFKAKVVKLADCATSTL